MADRLKELMRYVVDDDQCIFMRMDRVPELVGLVRERLDDHREDMYTKDQRIKALEREVGMIHANVIEAQRDLFRWQDRAWNAEGRLRAARGFHTTLDRFAEEIDLSKVIDKRLAENEGK